MHWIHNLLGAFVVGITVMTSVQMYLYSERKFEANAHTIIGPIALIMTVFVGVTGLITAGMMQFYTGDKPWSEREAVYTIAKVHKLSSYILLVLANGVCSGGIATYFSKIGYGIWGTFGVCTSIFFLLVVGLHEFCLRRKNSKNFRLVEGNDLARLIESKNLP